MKEAKPFTIVLADDDADDRLLAAEALEEARIANPVRFVRDGEELMKFLRNEAEPRPGLVLLDLNMPRKDGREALAEIKSDPALRDIAVVVLTTSQAEEDIAQVNSLGAQDFISKPVTFDGLVEVMRTLTRFGVEFVSTPEAPTLEG